MSSSPANQPDSPIATDIPVPATVILFGVSEKDSATNREKSITILRSAASSTSSDSLAAEPSASELSLSVSPVRIAAGLGGTNVIRNVRPSSSTFCLLSLIKSIACS